MPRTGASRTAAPRPATPARAWTTALLALALATAGLLAARARLDEAHIALVYLLVVLGGSAAGGRALGLVLSVVAFLAFDFLFLPPCNTLVIADPLDWLVLFAFLATGVVAAELLSRARAEAGVARRRAAEVDRLAALGAETLGAGRADEALAAIARVIRTTLDVGACDIFTWDAGRGSRPRHRARARRRAGGRAHVRAARGRRERVHAPPPGRRPRDRGARVARGGTRGRQVLWVLHATGLPLLRGVHAGPGSLPPRPTRGVRASPRRRVTARWRRRPWATRVRTPGDPCSTCCTSR